MLNVHAFLNSVSRAAVRLLEAGVKQDGRLEKLLGVDDSDGQTETGDESPGCGCSPGAEGEPSEDLGRG